MGNGLWKITLMGAHTVEVMRECDTSKEARKCAAALVMDWAYTTAQLMQQNMMPKCQGS